MWDNVYGLVASAIVTACVIYFVLRPVTLRPPQGCRRKRRIPSWVCLPIDYATAPIIGVVVLLVLQVFSFHGVYNGLKGNENIQPYTIIVIFFGLAYMSISFDCTGSFEFLALHAIRRSGRSAKKLYAYFWAVTSFVTVVASNDVAILTITPIICHFTQKMRLDPVPFLLMEFMAANIWSMTLFIGNPTNIIVGIAYKMSFVGYTMWMGTVAVVSGVLHFFLMRFMVRKELQAPLDSSAAAGVVPSSVIRSKFGAIFGCVVLGTCVALLCVAYWIGVELYVLCGVFWAVYLVKDVTSDLAATFCCRGRIVEPSKKFTPLPTESPAIGMDEFSEHRVPKALSVSPEPESALSEEERSRIQSEGSVTPTLKNSDDDEKEESSSSSSNGNEDDEEEDVTVKIEGPGYNENGEEEEKPLKDRLWDALACYLPTISAVGRRMPWKILPFVLGMFVLVQCLKDVGWVNNAAYAVSKASLNNTVFSTFVKYKKMKMKHCSQAYLNLCLFVCVCVCVCVC